jgi:hypothetical protein
MKDYQKTYCIEGDYFTPPETVPLVIEEEGKEPPDIIPQELPLSTDNYKKSGVTKRTYKLYEKES